MRVSKSACTAFKLAAAGVTVVIGLNGASINTDTNTGQPTVEIGREADAKGREGSAGGPDGSCGGCDRDSVGSGASDSNARAHSNVCVAKFRQEGGQLWVTITARGGKLEDVPYPASDVFGILQDGETYQVVVGSWNNPDACAKAFGEKLVVIGEQIKDASGAAKAMMASMLRSSSSYTFDEPESGPVTVRRLLER